MELHQEFYNHPKVKRLATALKERVPTVKGYVVNLWLYCVQFAQDGDLTEHIAELPGYLEVPTKPGYNIVRALVTVGFLDEKDGRTIVHGWADMGLRLLKNSRSRLDKHRKNKELGTKSETFQKRIRNVILTYLSDLSYHSDHTRELMASPEFLSIYTEWGVNRIQMGKPLTDVSIKRQLMFLARCGDDPSAVVRQSLERGWQGLFGIKEIGNARTGTGTKSASQQRAEHDANSPERQQARRNLSASLEGIMQGGRTGPDTKRSGDA